MGNCKQIKYNLLNLDTKVYYVHSVFEALKLMETNTYTLIILDVLLWQHGGAAILSAIRQLSDAPILALWEQASSAMTISSAIICACVNACILSTPFKEAEVMNVC